LLVTLEPDETGILVAECPAIPGCISQGRTEAEALENIWEAIVGCLETTRGKRPAPELNLTA
jgi:predicted RNase H-like HicB family nuclease